jgi:hypothetical protein
VAWGTAGGPVGHVTSASTLVVVSVSLANCTCSRSQHSGQRVEIVPVVHDLSHDGEVRDVEVQAGGTSFTYIPSRLVPAQLDEVFNDLARADYLRGRDALSFVSGLSEAWARLTRIHPSRGSPKPLGTQSTGSE